MNGYIEVDGITLSLCLIDMEQRIEEVRNEPKTKAVANALDALEVLVHTMMQHFDEEDV